MKYPRSRGLALAGTFAALISVSALLSIPLPFTPVPITLQVLAVYLAATIPGPAYGALACLIYLMMGAAGLPVFAGGSSGLGVLLGPFGGYLFSYPVAALLGGLISRNRAVSTKRDILRVSLSCLVAIAIIYGMGVTWLSAYLPAPHWLDLQYAFQLGAIPFIPVDALKAVVAIPIAGRIRRSRMPLPIGSSRDSLDL